MCAELTARWDKELVEVRERLAAHKEADRQYLEFGLRLFELAQNAYSSYLRRSPSEKRQMLNFLLSNCAMKDGALVPTYRQPFDLIASAPAMTKESGSPDLSDPDSRLLKWR